MFENIINFIFTYLLVFWIVIFCILPIGVNREEKPQAGNDHGAPANPMLKKKFIITASISLFITVIYTYLTISGIFTWEMLAE